jgi:hypothetical protein
VGFAECRPVDEDNVCCPGVGVEEVGSYGSADSITACYLSIQARVSRVRISGPSVQNGVGQTCNGSSSKDIGLKVT